MLDFIDKKIIYIKKGNIELKIGNKVKNLKELENFPEIIKLIFFNIRMSYNIYSD